MKTPKNKTFVSVMVGIVIIGLVGTYAPLLFVKPELAPEPSDYYPPEEIPLPTTSTVASTTTSTN